MRSSFNICALGLTYLFTPNMCHLATPLDPFRCSRKFTISRCYASFNGKKETCHILVPNELRNAELITVQLGLQ